MTTQTIDGVTVTVVNDLLFKVKVTGQRLKTFKGEFAWADAQRFANDALLTLRGTPFGPQFTL